jgi:hypothetical protein
MTFLVCSDVLHNHMGARTVIPIAAEASNFKILDLRNILHYSLLAFRTRLDLVSLLALVYLTQPLKTASKCTQPCRNIKGQIHVEIIPVKKPFTG